MLGTTEEGVKNIIIPRRKEGGFTSAKLLEEGISSKST